MKKNVQKIKLGRWFSLYIYLDGDVHEFLRFVKEKLVPKLAKNASKYFFIRYHDNLGFHIRLRFHTANNRLINDILSLLNTPNQKEFKIRLIQQKKYRRELKRYGRGSFIKEAESYFWRSSEYILNLAGRQKRWSYQQSVSAAILVNHASLLGINISNANKKDMLYSLYESWLEDTLLRQNGNLNRELVEAAFEKSYNKQKILIDNLIISSSSDDKLLEWQHYNKATTDILKSLTLNKYKNPALNTDLIIAELFQSYLHMNNNRLGLLNIDESFIFYILLKYF